MNAPPLPRRPNHSIPDPDDIPDEPPPAYEPTPSNNNEQTLEYGPRRPYQQAPAPPPHSSQPIYSPPQAPPQRQPSRSHRYQHPSQSNIHYQQPQSTTQNNFMNGNLPPPTFPFWNGSNLTPAQTGFIEGPALATFGSQPPPPLPSSSTSSSSTSRYEPPRPIPPLPANGYPSYSPTTTPIPGQPLLNNHQLLVYPPGKKEQCFKCENTGYKPFDFGTGWKGDDPNHPCRKCWSKFGKAFTSVLQHSLGTNQSVAPSNYQRPLRLLETPGQNPVHYGGLSTSNQQQRPVVFTTQRPHIDVLGNTLVVRPGDPRIGGVLCRACGGDGLQMGPFIFDEVSCTQCRGTGRVF